MTDDDTPGEDQAENPEGDSTPESDSTSPEVPEDSASQQREHTSPSEIAERNFRKYGDSEDLVEINQKLLEAANEKDMSDEAARRAYEERNAQYRTAPEPDEIEEVETDVDLEGLPGLEDDSPTESSSEDPDDNDEVIERIVRDIEEGGREAAPETPDRPGSRLRNVGVGASLFVAALFGMWNVFFSSDSDNATDPVLGSVPVVATAGAKTADTAADSVPVPATNVTESHTSADSSVATSIECDESAGDGVDSRFRVNCTNAMLDRLDRLWVMFPLGWGPTPPCCLKSGFFLGTFSYNPTVELGWETHDGVEIILGAPLEAYILDNGNVVFATGLSPTPPYQLDVMVNFASWQSDEDPVISGNYSASLSSDSIETGDPLVDFGGKPVFDLLASTPLTGD